MAGGFKRGSAHGGGPKKSFSKKRSSPSDDETPTRTAKKAKASGSDDEAEAEAFIPTLRTDDEKNPFLSIKSNDTRRITVSEFKGNTLISIREYYKDKESGVMRPGKKGIALTMEQWNALMAAAPLLEGVLKEKGETVSRPNYEGE